MPTETLSRRGVLKGFAGLGAAVVSGSFPQVLSAENEVPPILENVFTTDREKSTGGSVIKANDAVNDENGRTHAVYCLQEGGQVQRIDFDPITNKYELRQNSARVPILMAQTIVGFANFKRYGNENIVVGGFDGGSPDPQTAVVAVSPDSGNTFESIPLTDNLEKPVMGVVKEMKRITNRFALLSAGNIGDIKNQYGLFDSETNKFRLVSVASGDLPLPLLDNLKEGPDGSTIYVTGRVIRKSHGNSYIQGVAGLRLDLDDAFIID